MLKLTSAHTYFDITLEALVLPSISSLTPAVQIDVDQWKYLDGLPLADETFGTPGPIDVLIGADQWGRIVQGDIIGGKLGEPYAQRTCFDRGGSDPQIPRCP